VTAGEIHKQFQTIGIVCNIYSEYNPQV